MYDVFYKENRLYIAVNEVGLEIVINPSLLIKISSYKTPGYAWGVGISGNYVYVADGDAGLRIIDVSNLQNLYEIGYYDIPGSARNIAVVNDYIFVADE